MGANYYFYLEECWRCLQKTEERIAQLKKEIELLNRMSAQREWRKEMCERRIWAVERQCKGDQFKLGYEQCEEVDIFNEW